MANPYARQTANRKLIYLGAVLALFTAALWHRQVNIKPLGEDLQLRETTRGEIDLTSSALRLTLSGSRGMAVTILWMQANLLQDRGEWHELELVVDSITKLQPYFIEPWVWQSWNLAYNVGRELDRPLDKYYYVSRGMQMLAEGERRNQGTEKFPGNPDMRIQIGKMYEDKIGLADERNAMRSLFELSCIDPRQRDPRRFWNAQAPEDKALNPKEFLAFCREQPRLVRRLADKLNYRTPREVYQYLWTNREVPTRFEEYDWRVTPDFNIQASTKVRRDPFQHFPLFPARLGKQEDPSMTEAYARWLRGEPLPEGNDVFVLARTWMIYAQDPFPPNSGDPSDTKLPAHEPWKYRLAKRPPLYICRSFPATSQIHIADQLQAEGWFLHEGWPVPETFQVATSRGESPIVGERESFLDSQKAWQKAYETLRSYGIETGLYYPPVESAKLEAQAQAYRTKYEIPPFRKGTLPADAPPEMHTSYDAHVKLYHAASASSIINFEGRLERAEAERDPATIKARRVLYQAKAASQAGERKLFLRLNYQFWPMWLDVMLKHPRFVNSEMLMQDMIEDQHRFLRAEQRSQPEFFQNLCIGMAQLAIHPKLPLGDPNFKIRVRTSDGGFEELPLLDETDRLNIVPIRNVHGPLEMMRVLNVSSDAGAVLRLALAAWPQSGASPVYFAPLAHHNWLFARQELRDAPFRDDMWRHLVPDSIVNPVRQRLGLTK
jgi:hypothetical protein